jgi:hypothetical protein
MRLGLTVTALVLGVTVLFAIAGYLIDLSARHFERSRDKGDR